MDVTSTVLDRGNEIILVNWPDDKHILCNINNDIPVKFPSQPYMLVNRSVLCNCWIEAENNFLLEALSACHDAGSKLVMYVMVNAAFVNYLDNLTKSLKFPILLNRTTYKQTLSISLRYLTLNLIYTKHQWHLKDFNHQFGHQNEIFDLKKRHNNDDLSIKISFWINIL